MRIQKEKVALDYQKTRKFFEDRGLKYDESHPYVTTMYQDQNPQLTDARNQEEVSRILPLLQLNAGARVLDIGCGIGRWADAIPCDVESYLGIDFSESLTEIARRRNTRDHFSYEQMSACDFKAYYQEHDLKPFTHLIVAGVFTYLNDEDVERILGFIPEILSPGAVFYLREPVGVDYRLTLKDFYSAELKHDYHTIYRPAEEYRRMLQKNAPALRIEREEYLFADPALNNRKETSQYYLILRKGAAL